MLKIATLLASKTKAELMEILSYEELSHPTWFHFRDCDSLIETIEKQGFTTYILEYNLGYSKETPIRGTDCIAEIRKCDINAKIIVIGVNEEAKKAARNSDALYHNWMDNTETLIAKILDENT